MAVSLTRLSWWLWGGKKEKEPVSINGSSSSSTEWGFPMKEREAVMKFPLVKGTKVAPSSHRNKVKRKWQSREDRRIRDHHDDDHANDIDDDVVLVPSDGGGGCLSGSESDDSDWSIGWLEPHGSSFQSFDDESDNSFAVLVPCYRPGCKEVEGSNNELLSVINDLPNEFSSAGMNYMDRWLASIQNFRA
ncbi:uncharacterized protein LOC107487253 [Arachis duranensis]|uniref:Uncharacterized protein LOC107487253 n=2 Tax=Arachis TaxID=3817 RepID=A0A6P4D962_ARADU|nr:uncharacterized protein LOC107487253 [Arachis duranensis]XP_025651083.1 uncharacterized protein LOC112747332 [Arachis hypogaea]XP_025697740.1 uncharacterized protein LOC112799949 [Arachis hypogaea]XP_052117244.1 uncharacterized protein LOC107487253 [Arachis duranensis]XP_057759280.1 uncharacterized protein LOC130979759 [Arachis stenosperma]QHO44380.1 uncharacterized protein DS421_5g170620 [Arachis hypogaea]RYQ81618.1 hypothetical protein Ahy_Scaffold1g107503 isoform A [Arachis hypogaea]RY